ncbi:hypothetical protein ACFQU7_14010 [Pseudoroseomonas wenyumeiae]
MRSAGLWSSALALIAALLLPWYLVQDGIGVLSYADGGWLTDPDGAPPWA